jgi:hypothetical protein
MENKQKIRDQTAQRQRVYLERQKELGRRQRVLLLTDEETEAVKAYVEKIRREAGVET